MNQVWPSLHPVNADEALRDICGYAAAGRVRVTVPAQQRVGQRGARYVDVVYASVNATGCRAAEAERWRATEPDLEGDELTAIVVLEDRVLVVTMF